jgi:hypothetical protein
MRRPKYSLPREAVFQYQILLVSINAGANVLLDADSILVVAQNSAIAP